ncbi:MAG: sigma-70 family RNA polymerase sigma factor [Bacteroidota bacterium]
MNTALSEKELLKRLAKNDKQATETIYKDHYNMVQALIINNNGSAEEARDIFQETMIVLYEKAKSGGFELNCLLKTYLYSISRRLWLKRLHQIQKYAGRIDNIKETVPVEGEIEGHEQRNFQFQAMEKSLMNLGEPCKSLLEAYYLQKRSMTEIATSFGYTNADNAKNQKYKCLNRLKRLFFAQHKKSEHKYK